MFYDIDLFLDTSSLKLIFFVRFRDLIQRYIPVKP